MQTHIIQESNSQALGSSINQSIDQSISNDFSSELHILNFIAALAGLLLIDYNLWAITS
jgi:hypothetical protein